MGLHVYVQMGLVDIPWDAKHGTMGWDGQWDYMYMCRWEGMDSGTTCICVDGKGWTVGLHVYV